MRPARFERRSLESAPRYESGSEAEAQGHEIGGVAVLVEADVGGHPAVLDLAQEREVGAQIEHEAGADGVAPVVADGVRLDQGVGGIVIGSRSTPDSKRLTFVTSRA